MMFKGSKRLSPGEYSRRIAAMGGNDNAFTSHDYTAYFETVPAARVNEVLQMEAERFANLKLRNEDFRKEIKVIMEERRMRTEDDPNSHMFEELSAAALRLHPYRNPVIGWMQDLERLTIKDVRAFYKKHYVPGNVTVVVVGDVDFESVKKTVRKTFGRMKKRPVPERFNPKEPAPFGHKRIDVTLPAQLPLLAITLPVPVWQPGINDRESAAIAIATELLAGGRSARLTRELVDKKRVSFSASTGYDPFGMGLDLWYAYGVLGPKQTPGQFEQSFWAMIKQMRDTPPTPGELQAAKRRITAAEIFARDSLYLRAKHIGILETVGIGAVHQDEWLAAIRHVTAADVQNVFRQWIRFERSTTGLLKPEKKS
jgi:zinc protease